MARISRFTYPDAYYHIMNRGNKGSNIFIRDDDYRRYIDLLGQYAEQYRIKVLAYCLMPNHFHLLIQDPFEFISFFMKVLHGRYAQYLNKKERNRGHIFQDRFKSIIVDKKSYLLEVSRYIHLNPVKAHITEAPDMYKWSSYNFYVKSNFSLPGWLDISDILEYFNGNRKEYKGFVMEGIKKDIPLTPLKYKHGLFYGSADFAEKVIHKAERRKDKKRKGSKRWEDRHISIFSKKYIIEIILKEFEVDDISDIIDNREHKYRYIKGILGWFLDEYTLLTRTEIAAYLGYASAGGLSNMLRRLDKSEEIRAEINKIIDKWFPSR